MTGAGMTGMMFKQQIKKRVGKNNVERVSLLKGSIKVLFHRGIRSCRFYLRREKRDSPKIQKFAVPNSQTFFGYYDITPFSKSSDLLLSMVGPRRNKQPRENEEILVGYFDRRGDGIFKPVDRTSTWCWQMGCRLQWFPEDENRLVIYNKMADTAYGCVVQDIKTKEILMKLSRPIYQIDKDGKHALSLNFSRLHRLRPGYGYGTISDPSEGKVCPDDDGVWLMNLVSGEEQLILSLKHLSEIHPSPTMEDAEHYVNHLAFNPSGSRFMFFHLWVSNGYRYNRLITCDTDGQNIYILTNEGLVSHYTWKSDTELLATMHHKSIGTRYYLFRDSSDVRTKIGDGLLTKDGHPSFSPDSSSILTDTYPDKYGEQRLLLYTPDQGLIELSRFFSPVRFRGEVRCDLHPRWDRSGQYVCVDSAHDGGRALYVIRLDDLQIQKPSAEA